MSWCLLVSDHPRLVDWILSDASLPLLLYIPRVWAVPSFIWRGWFVLQERRLFAKYTDKQLGSVCVCVCACVCVWLSCCCYHQTQNMYMLYTGFFFFLLSLVLKPVRILLSVSAMVIFEWILLFFGLWSICLCHVRGDRYSYSWFVFKMPWMYVMMYARHKCGYIVILSAFYCFSLDVFCCWEDVIERVCVCVCVCVLLKMN